jgi:hypothetical protein
MIERLAARLCGFQRDRKLLLRPINSLSRLGRSFSSNEFSSSARALEMRRSGLSPYLAAALDTRQV